MLFIVFQLGQDRYALDAQQVVEVLPILQLKILPHAPAGIAGILDYHGSALPVVDLTLLALGRPAELRISTRLLIVALPDGRRLALIAERANGFLNRELSDFVATGVTNSAAPYLGPVTQDAIGFVQQVSPEQFFSPAVRDALYTDIKEAA